MATEFHEVRVIGIVQETPDTRSFVLGVPKALRGRFSYRAGQFLSFEIPWQGFSIRRSYSLSSSPESDPSPKVTVKRVKDGRVSNWFNDQVKIGDTLRVLAPEGRFLLKPGEASRSITLFGGGSGITPVLSLLKSALLSTRRDVFLVYANRDEDSIIFRDELELLLRIFPTRLRVHHHLDSDGGFLTVEHVRKLVSASVGSDFYVCGPTAYMDTVEIALQELGVSPADRFFERFTSPLDPDRRPPETPAGPPGEAPASFSLKLEGKTQTVPYRQGATLLQSAVEAGVDAPSSCEDGYCGCCMCFLNSGKVHMATHEALTPNDIQKGWILACQARPTSAEPLAVDFDAKY